MNSPIRRALISVSDKTGLVDLGRFLDDQGVEILSTGGSAKALQEAGVPVVQVSDHTGFPEIMDGRVKTLQPAIHGGLLGHSRQSRARARHGGAWHRPDRPAGGQSLSVRGDGGQGRVVRHVHREHRYRRTGVDPGGIQEPCLRDGGGGCRRLCAADGRDDIGRRQHHGRIPPRAGGQGLRPDRRLRCRHLGLVQRASRATRSPSAWCSPAPANRPCATAKTRIRRRRSMCRANSGRGWPRPNRSRARS